jgi:GAF domain-containing protein
MALNLMHIISESVDRAVLFLVRKSDLLALGAFGFASDGRPLAEATRGLNLPTREVNVLTRCLADGQPRSLSFEHANLPPEFANLIGRPHNGQIVVFPVMGSERVISVVYTDNGSNARAIEDIELLELATAQVGVAFENELLRRQIESRR